MLLEQNIHFSFIDGDCLLLVTYSVLLPVDSALFFNVIFWKF